MINFIKILLFNILKTMLYKTQCEAVRVCRQDFPAVNFNNYFLSLGEIISSYNFHSSKQKTRLKFYFDLLEKYRYPVSRVEFDVAAPSAGENCLADIVVFRDSEGKVPFIAVHCDEDKISASGFQAGVKIAIEKAEAIGAEFAVCITHTRRRIVKLTYLSGNTYAKTVCDLPIWRGE